MSLLKNILITIGCLVIVVMLVAIMKIRGWIEWTTLLTFIIILLIAAFGVIIFFIYEHLVKPEKKGVEMKLTPDENIKQTKHDMLFNRGMRIITDPTTDDSLLDYTYTGKQVVVHLFSAIAYRGMRKMNCFFIRRLDNPDLRDVIINKELTKDDIRDMLNHIALGKMTEDEIITIEENATLGTRRYVRQKKYTPLPEEEKEKEVLVPEKEVPKPEAKKEAVPSG